jgi:hypothetical protein
MNKHNTSPISRLATLKWLPALFLLAAVGCGGSDDDPATPAAAGPAPAPAPAPAPPPPLPTIAAAVNLDPNQQIGVTSTFWVDGDTTLGGLGQLVQGVLCVPSLVQTFHIHSHLSIFVNGQAQAIAANVGILDTPVDCHYYVHTHDHSGKIHMEAPVQTTFTLGQLFAIWGQPLTTTNVAGIQGMAQNVYVTENGTVTQFTGDPATIEMTSHRHIAIVLGTPIAQVPFFTWTAN